MFPFSPNTKTNSMQIFNQKDFADSLVWELMIGKISWESAHLKMANYYLKKNDYEKYIDEINVLIDDKPFDKFPYLEAIKSLEKLKKPEFAKLILHKYYNFFADLFSARKLADIYFDEKNHNNSIYFYNKCLDFGSNDPEIYFNLSASYYGIRDLPLSLENISKCLKIDPNYPNAQKIYNGLLNIYNSQK